MNRFYRSFIFCLCMLAGASVLAGNNFRVSDTYVTVFEEPERINALSRMTQGEEFEAIGRDGSMLIFMYKGKKAYVASYCCKEIEKNPAETTKQAPPGAELQKVEVAREDSPAEDASASGSQTQEYITRSVGTASRNNSLQGIAEWQKGLLGILVMLGLVAGIWSLFGMKSFDNFFNRLAQRHITSCSKLMHWRPVIPFVVGALIGYLTNNVTLAVAAVAIYELCVIMLRTKKLGSFRAAVVEAVYLCTSAMGTLLFFYIFIIFAFLAAGGSGGSSSGDDDKKRKNAFGHRACYNCTYWDHGRCRRHNTVVGDGDCCGDHVWM